MGFSSPIFVFYFLPLVLLGYFLLPSNARKPYRNVFLLSVSIFFYAWGEKFFVQLLLYSLIFNHTVGNKINDSKNPQKRWYWLLFGVIANISLLVIFKYGYFFVENTRWFWYTFSIRPPLREKLHLPIGISFFTFQAISYLIDIYRRELVAQRNFISFGVYVFLFPHLIAGPIVRYKDIAGQISERPVSVSKLAEGIRRFIIGLAKKMLFANTFGQTADMIFQYNPQELSSGAAWLGILCYTLQIYFDFSGYSDMAIGLGKMFGFDFLENFNYPYIATSITDFWRRWHISLSSWFRDYVYIPLGGNRCSSWKTYRNLMIVFILCGLWHGANWTFVIWGMYHGCFLVLERLGFAKILHRLPKPLQHSYMLMVVILGWIFFRSADLDHACQYITQLIPGTTSLYSFADFWNQKLALTWCFGIIACVPILPWTQEQISRWKTNHTKQKEMLLETVTSMASMIGLQLIMFLVIVRITSETYQPFIYFQF